MNKITGKRFVLSKYPTAEPKKVIAGWIISFEGKLIGYGFTKTSA